MLPAQSLQGSTPHPQYKSVYQDMRTEQNVPENSETHMSSIVGSKYGTSFMSPRIWRLFLDFWEIYGPLH